MDFGVYGNIVLIAIGFVFLIKGADLLVNGGSSLAKRFNVSDIAIGLTVVAMGTSAPELVVSIISGIQGKNEMVYGNIIGSNIFNLFMILGISSVIYPLTVQRNALWKEIPYSLFITIMFFIFVNDVMFFESEANTLGMADSIALIALFGVFLIYIFMNLKRHPEEVDGEEIVVFGTLKTSAMILFGIGGLVLGGKMIVDSAVTLATTWGMSEKLIGLTILAAGTSLPELATSAVAAFQKKSDLAVGNIIGSNIFNILFVIGLSSLISGPMPFDTKMNIDIYFMMGGTVLLFVFMFTLSKYKLDRAEGFVYILFYLAYSYFIFTRA